MDLPRTFFLIAALTTACLAGAAPAGADGLEFSSAPDIRARADTGNASPQHSVIGDFNSDTHPDIATADYSRDLVLIDLGRGDGTFERADELAAGRPSALAVGDFDSDGTQDLAVAARATPTFNVLILRGRGNGKFDLATALVLPGGTTAALAVGDFNGDSKDDIAGATGTYVATRLNAGGFAFSPGGEIQTATRADAVEVADFDGNGTDDLVAVLNAPLGAGESAVAVFAGKGDGSFEPRQRAGLPNIGFWLAVGDFNGDAREDVAVTILTENRVSIRLGNGDGTLSDDSPDVPVGSIPIGVAVADFDADGREDLAAASSMDDKVTVHRGAGDGTFGAGVDVAVGDGPLGVAAADLDSNGRVDFLADNFDDVTISVRLGTGPSALGGNLLVNGGFEQSLGARLPSQSPAVPGWTVTGGATAVRYGTVPHVGFPSLLDAPRYGNGGRNFLWGGDSTGLGGITTATQTADVAASAEAIDSGRATAQLSAYLGGAGTYADTMDITAEFLAADGATLGDVAVGPVTKDDRRNLTTLVRRAASGLVPAGTRRIRVRARSVDGDTVSSAIADNVKLTLDVAPPPEPAPGGETPGGPPAETPGPGTPPPGPPPATTKPAFGRATKVTVALAATRLRATATKVPVVVANGNAFAVSGTVSGTVTDGRRRLGSLRARRVSVPGSRKTRTELVLPRAARARLAGGRRLTVRLTASVTDPAGNKRTAQRRASLRIK